MHYVCYVNYFFMPSLRFQLHKIPLQKTYNCHYSLEPASDNYFETDYRDKPFFLFNICSLSLTSLIGMPSIP